MRQLLAVLLIAWTAPAAAQDHHHPPQDGALHDRFYSTWQKPDHRDAQGARFQSCCSKQDCYPTVIKKIGGRWHALRREDLRWIAVPDGILEHNTSDPRESPDEGSHACMPPPTAWNAGVVFCAVLGGGT